jgi:hypothetical protein
MVNWFDMLNFWVNSVFWCVGTMSPRLSRAGTNLLIADEHEVEKTAVKVPANPAKTLVANRDFFVNNYLWQ